MLIYNLRFHCVNFLKGKKESGNGMHVLDKALGPAVDRIRVMLVIIMGLGYQQP